MKEKFVESFEKLNSILNLKKYPSPLQTIFTSNSNLTIKRDDLLDLACSKQRSIPLMISDYLEKGNQNFVISSSGNAALVAAYVALKEQRIQTLKVFLSNEISDYKIEKFIKYLNLEISKEEFRKGFKLENVEFILSENAKQQAFLLQKDGFINLRGSTEDIGILGFKTLGYEIAEQLPSVDAIFIPSSSGSTAIGVYEGLKEKGLSPQIHIVQTTRVFALIKKINQEEFTKELEHSASAISDIVGHRRNQIEQIIKNSTGSSWIISNEETKKARIDLFNNFEIETSFDSALSFAAYNKAIDSGNRFKNPLILFTG